MRITSTQTRTHTHTHCDRHTHIYHMYVYTHACMYIHFCCHIYNIRTYMYYVRCLITLLSHSHIRTRTVKGYPVIDGVLQLTDVMFARFPANSADCHYGTFAIGNNRLSPDAVHPLVISSTTLLDCDTSSLVYFHDPDPTWINQEVCVWCVVVCVCFNCVCG